MSEKQPNHSVDNERESLRQLSNRLLIYTGCALTAFPAVCVGLNLLVREVMFSLREVPVSQFVTLGAIEGTGIGALSIIKAIWDIRNEKFIDNK